MIRSSGTVSVIVGMPHTLHDDAGRVGKATCETIKDEGDFCTESARGDKLEYNKDNAKMECASSTCDKNSVNDVTACCKEKRTCELVGP